MAARSRKYRPRFELCVWHRTPELRHPHRTFLLLSAWPAAPCYVWPAVGISRKKSDIQCVCVFVWFNRSSNYSGGLVINTVL